MKIAISAITMMFAVSVHAEEIIWTPDHVKARLTEMQSTGELENLRRLISPAAMEAAEWYAQQPFTVLEANPPSTSNSSPESDPSHSSKQLGGGISGEDIEGGNGIPSSGSMTDGGHDESVKIPAKLILNQPIKLIDKKTLKDMLAHKEDHFDLDAQGPENAAVGEAIKWVAKEAAKAGAAEVAKSAAKDAYEWVKKKVGGSSYEQLIFVKDDYFDGPQLDFSEDFGSQYINEMGFESSGY